MSDVPPLLLTDRLRRNAEAAAEEALRRRLQREGAKAYHDLLRLPEPLSRRDVSELLGRLLRALSTGEVE